MHFSYNNKQILYRKKNRNSENEIKYTKHENLKSISDSQIGISWLWQLANWKWNITRKLIESLNRSLIYSETREELCTFVGIYIRFIIARIEGVLIGLLEEFGDRQDQVNANLNCIVSESVLWISIEERDHRNIVGLLWRYVYFEHVTENWGWKLFSFFFWVNSKMLHVFWLTETFFRINFFISSFWRVNFW